MNQNISISNFMTIKECEKQINEWVEEAQCDLAKNKPVHSSTQKVLSIAKTSLLAGTLLALFTPRYAHRFNVKRSEAWKISLVLIATGSALLLFNLKELQANYQQDSDFVKSLAHRIACLKLFQEKKVSKAIEALKQHPEWISVDKGLETLDRFAKTHYHVLYSMKSHTQNAKNQLPICQTFDYVIKLLWRVGKIALPI